ncbi:MAG: 50S ribosomal protein L10 [Planctomycetes bacterium]|nr:50S ribosomal protein L10 [Planctomycetota bacterium]
MPSEINKLTVAELVSRFRATPNAVLVDFTGLKAGQADVLRAKLREQGARMSVVKNSLAKHALTEMGLPSAAKLFVGPVALVSGADAASLARFLREWSRKERVLKWSGALVGGEVVGPQGVDAIATLPPLKALQAQAVGAMAAPLSGLLGALQGILRNFAGVVKAIAEKQQAAG